MGFEKPTSEYHLSRRLGVELPPSNGLELAITRVIENSEMFQLPNKPEVTNDRFQLNTKALAKQYTVALQYEKTKNETLSEIKSLLQIDKKDNDWIKKIEVTLEKAPQEAAPELMWNLENLSEEIREEIVHLALEKAPQEAAPRLMWNLQKLPEEIREEIIHLAFEKAPKEAAPALMKNLEKLPEEVREEIVHLALEKAPQEAAPELMWNLQKLPEEIREEIVHLALEKAPQEAAPELMWNLQKLPEEIREEIIHLAFEKAPKEAASELMKNFEKLPEEVREEIVHLALEKAPQEAAPRLMWNLQKLPEEIREEIIHLAFEKAPKEAAPALMKNLEKLPEEVREEIIHLAFEKAPQKAAPELMKNLERLPEEIREEIIHLAFEKAPKEAAPALMKNLEKLPEEVREKFESQAMEILQTTEKKKLTESENINPILYKEVDGLEKQLSRKEFPKTGTRTVLLGGTLKNNAILRIIPNQAFISWVEAYSAVEKWKEAEFDYVPIEPILKASLSKDGKNARVYAGVLGVSVAEYLEMYSNRKHHENVEQQVKVIRETLKKIGVSHGHEHNHNFCVLHNRTPKGKIDWNIPPRVYCIDFDESFSS
ncbi:MAG: hypothetical protein U9R00_03380 [Patescibacteria group bacterium]|nr:hypothetical protein [Patescibacteria group bacterium]